MAEINQCMLSPKKRFLYFIAFQKVAAGIFHEYAADFENVSSVGYFKRHARILLNKQYTCPCFIYLDEFLKNYIHICWRETK